MNKFVKPPSLSTNFSESGKQAKKRFANILNTKAKKTGVLALMLVLCISVVMTTLVACNNTNYIYKNKSLGFSFEIPKSWEGKYEIVEVDRGITVYQSDIVEKFGEGTGRFFSIELLEGTIEKNKAEDTPWPTHFLMQANGYTYVMSMPSDVQSPIWDGGDKELAAEYEKMFKDIDKIRESIEPITITNDSNGSDIEKLLSIIGSSPAMSSNPNDYIKEHKAEFDEIVEMDTDALSYMFSEFEKGACSDLRGHIMASACLKILEGENIAITYETGQQWYNQYKGYIREEISNSTYESVKKKHPKGCIVLDLNKTTE